MPLLMRWPAEVPVPFRQLPCWGLCLHSRKINIIHSISKSDTLHQSHRSSTEVLCVDQVQPGKALMRTIGKARHHSFPVKVRSTQMVSVAQKCAVGKNYLWHSWFMRVGKIKKFNTMLQRFLSWQYSFNRCKCEEIACSWFLGRMLGFFSLPLILKREITGPYSDSILLLLNLSSPIQVSIFSGNKESFGNLHWDLVTKTQWTHMSAELWFQYVATVRVTSSEERAILPPYRHYTNPGILLQ